MKKMAKTISFIIALVLLVAIFAGCGTSNKASDNGSEASAKTDSSQSTASVKEEPLVIDYLSMLPSYPIPPDENNPMHKWLLENKNIDVKFNSVTEKQEDKMNLMLASGDFPDVINVLTSNINNPIINKWGEAGLVIPMNEWIVKYPDLIKFGDEKYNNAVYANKADGKLYIIPSNFASISERLSTDIGPGIREDWLKIVGMSAPKTPDELYEVLKAFRDKIPDVDGKKIIPSSYNGFLQFIINAWTQHYFNLSDDRKTLNFQWNDPSVEEALVYLNKLTREGLFDKESLTQTQEQWEAKLASGRVGYTMMVRWWMDAANAALKAKDESTRFIPCSPLRIEGKKMPLYQSPSPNAYSGVAISTKFAADSKKLERLMEFLNWNMSNEGGTILTYGLEGDYYVKNSEGLLEEKPDVKEERTKPNNTFLQRTGTGYYNIMMYEPIPKVTVDLSTPEIKLAGVWKEAWEQYPMEWMMTTPGPVESEKWGAMWGDFEKHKAKAIFAKTEEECRKAVKDMLAAYETNGGRDIVNERLATIAKYMQDNK